MTAPTGSSLFTYGPNGEVLLTLSKFGPPSPIANMAALQAQAATSLTDGQAFVLQTDGSPWRYAAASTLTSDTGAGAGPFFVATATTAGAGAFLRMTNDLDLSLAIGFGTADNAVLYTVPVGFVLRVQRTFYQITTSFTGGTSSAIGASSSDAAYSTAGDIQGGASGDLAAALVSTGGSYKAGTVGAKFGSNGVVVLVGGDTIKFNRIASVFTAGAGFLHAHVSVVTMPAA